LVDFPFNGESKMKTQKPLWRLSVATTLEAEDAVAEMVGDLLNGRASMYFDVEKQTSIVSLFSTKKIPRDIRTRLAAGLKNIKACGLDIGPGRISIGRVKAQDWAESWKRHFKPITIGNALLIKPSWSKQRPRPGQAVVILDPGLSFGTGQHPTTSFCLQQLVAAMVKSPQTTAKNAARSRAAATKSFLDIGTGSGILAIAAVKLGYRPVEAFDFDPAAVRVARANAVVNDANGAFFCIRRDDITRQPVRSEKFDVVCANLISNLLIAERRKIVNRLKRKGLLVLAGILKSEFSTVKTAFERTGLRLVSCRGEKEWMSGAFTH